MFFKPLEFGPVFFVRIKLSQVSWTHEIHLELQMVSRTELPHAFTRGFNPKREGALEEELSDRTVSVRMYAEDMALLDGMKNRSNVVRDAVRKHLRGIEPEA